MGDIIDFQKKKKEKEEKENAKIYGRILKRISCIILKKEEFEIPPDNPPDVA